MENDLLKNGFAPLDAGPAYRLFYHPRAQLPRVVLRDKEQPLQGVAVRRRRIEGFFLMVRGIEWFDRRGPYSGFRRCCLSKENDISFWVIERRGTELIEPTYPDESYLEKYMAAVEKWKTRSRDLVHEEETMRRTLALAEEIVELLGKDLAAAVVLDVERSYWQCRNAAGQIQKNRQDRLGMR